MGGGDQSLKRVGSDSCLKLNANACVKSDAERHLNLRGAPAYVIGAGKCWFMTQQSDPNIHSFTQNFRIIGGGQTGADRAGLDTAIARNILHGGWCPIGRKAEDGRIPDCYRLIETPASGYLVRTERNVIESDATVIFTLDALSGGSKYTAKFAKKHQKPCLHLQIKPGQASQAARALASFLRANRVAVLNVAGSRESKAPGIHVQASSVLALALDQLDVMP